MCLLTHLQVAGYPVRPHFGAAPLGNDKVLRGRITNPSGGIICSDVWVSDFAGEFILFFPRVLGLYVGVGLEGRGVSKRFKVYFWQLRLKGVGGDKVGIAGLFSLVFLETRGLLQRFVFSKRGWNSSLRAL